MTNTFTNLYKIDQQIIKKLQKNSGTNIADMGREIGKPTENAFKYGITIIQE